MGTPQNSFLEITTMLCHPAELGVRDVLAMNRSHLIATLLEFNSHFGLRFHRNNLVQLSNTILRQTLLDVRRHYQARGY